METLDEVLGMVELGVEDHKLVALLHEKVIKPNLDYILSAFHATLMKYPLFKEMIASGIDVDHMMKMQSNYIISLGVDFDKPEYFTDRSRIGLTHVRAGVPLDLYLFSYRKLQQLLIESIPQHTLPQGKVEQLIAVILKITTLDICLAANTYHLSKVEALKNNVEALHCRNVLLEQQAGVDYLTGLASRHRIMEILSENLLARNLNNASLSVVMADLDMFKFVNDTHGHLFGDQVLKAVAARMQSAVRDNDVVGRYGGEEFIIVLINKSLAEAISIAERIRVQVGSTPIRAHNATINITISLGVAEAHDIDTVDDLIARADAALYQAKEAGKNRVTAEHCHHI